MKGPLRNVVALVLGLALGWAVARWGGAVGAAGVKVVAPVGALWLSGLRMTLVPLVFSLVVVGVAGLSGATAGRRLLPRTLGFFLVVLAVLAAAVTVGVTVVLDLVPPVAHFGGEGAAGAAAVPASSAPATPLPSLPERLLALVPLNPVESAAKADLGPLVIFALILGLALHRVEASRREAVVRALQGVGDAMMVIVEAVLWAAPVGVFALALRAGASVGLGAAGLLAQGGLMNIVVQLGVILLCYPLATLGGRVGLMRFVRAALGPQAMAAGTCSSMATLPAVVKAARDDLRLPTAIVDAVPAMAVSLFRMGTLTSGLVGSLFAARAAGLHPDAGKLAAAAAVAVVTSVGIAGLPSAVVIYALQAPIFQALGAPLDILPLMVAAAALPDIFITTANTTGHFTATAVSARFLDGEEETAAEPAPG